MKVFELKDNQIIIDPNFLTIPEFGAIWDKDKTKDKHTAVTHFTYIYHVCDHASPYSNYPIAKRMEAVQADLITDPKWKQSKEIREAIDYGVIKMNIDTDLQFSLTEGVRDYMINNSEYLMKQIGNPEGNDVPNKKYYDPRVWLRKGEETFKRRLIKAFEDLNNINTLD